jgi:hypothetical protein
MMKATVAFVYVVGTLQTAFALHDFYSLFCIPKDYKPSTMFFDTWGYLHRFGFMWITIPLSGASGALVFHLHFLALRPYGIR